MLRDLRSNLEAQVVFNKNITSSTTTAGTYIIDTVNYDKGMMFVIQAPVYTDGTFALSIKESDAANMAGAVEVTGYKLIGTYAEATLSAAVAEGALLKTIGVFSNHRYLRVDVVSTSVTSGARIEVIAVKAPELLPAV